MNSGCVLFVWMRRAVRCPLRHCSLSCFAESKIALRRAEARRKMPAQVPSLWASRAVRPTARRGRRASVSLPFFIRSGCAPPGAHDHSYVAVSLSCGESVFRPLCWGRAVVSIFWGVMSALRERRLNQHRSVPRSNGQRSASGRRSVPPVSPPARRARTSRPWFNVVLGVLCLT
jgi:hypothetical protein